MLGAMAATAAGPAPSARKPLPDFAASISRAITRPCGPEPDTRLRSTPASLARRRASGDEKVRLLPLAGAGVAFGCGAGAAAFGGAAGGFGASEVLAGGAAFEAPAPAAFTSSP